MFVPAELIDPILDDMLHLGRVDRPPRPWLGLYTADVPKDGIADPGARDPAVPPSAPACISATSCATSPASPSKDLADFYRSVWQRGTAGDRSSADAAARRPPSRR